MNKSKGFTVIELIVVIVIIAVLATIILFNITAYIAKSKNSAIRGNMATMLTNSSVYYDRQTTPTYVGFSTDQLYLSPASAVGKNGGIMGVAGTTATNFC